MTSPISNVPFQVDYDTDVESGVVFHRIVDHPLSTSHEEQLRDLVGSSTKLICDFSASEAVTSEWLLFLGVLSDEAAAEGKQVVIAALRTDIREDTVAALALEDRLQVYDTI